MRPEHAVRLGILLALITVFCQIGTADTSPPNEPVKLIFIHHSVGENWLADDNGGLGRALGENNYFVSDTNYGWGPEIIGDRTDIPNWLEWFASPESGTILSALYSESRNDVAGYQYYTRSMADPGGENEVIIFKPCFTNSNMGGSPDDPAGSSPDLTVAGAKYVYNEILNYFRQHPEKLFIAVTPPPEISSEYAAQAEAFSRWMETEWLSGYSGTNVGVFNIHSVLSSPDNHHTASGSDIVSASGHGNTLVYPTDDAHPSSAGNQKATREFVPLLNYYVHRWLDNRSGEPDQGEHNLTATSEPTPVITAEPTVLQSETNATPQSQGSEPLVSSGQEGDQIREDWVTYDDGKSEIHLTQEADKSGFCIDTRVDPVGWTSVETLFPTPRDWSGFSGVSFHIQSEKPGFPYSIALYSMGNQGEKRGYMKALKTAGESQGETVTVRWKDLTSLDEPGTMDAQMAGGIFFAFGSDQEETGRVCISQIMLIR